MSLADGPSKAQADDPRFPDHFFLTTFPAVFPFFPLSSFVHSAQRTDFTLIIFGKSDQGSKGSELIDTLCASLDKIPVFVPNYTTGNIGETLKKVRILGIE